ncbi:MAG: Gfo/Idh/MocA family oxidoreductase [Pirellulaceae bacterium]
MSRRKSRRQFLKTTAALGVGYWVAGGIAPRASRAAIEEIRFACVGVNGKGASDSADAGRSGKVVAICDIDESSLNKAGDRFEDAAKYFDYRKMLDETHKSIDAITVSTPDHMHAPVAAMAMSLGKHAFVQKPMTKSIYEARLLSTLATKHKLATQMGNQGTASNPLRESAAIIKSGVLGTVKEVHVWTNRPVWPQGEGRPADAPQGDAKIVELKNDKGEVTNRVHWDNFIGVAEFRPYHPAYHPFKWRGWWAFGTGALGDMACHTLNMPFMALNLRDPLSVQATTSGHNKETFPSWSIIDYEFGELNGRAPLKFVWYDGGKKADPALLHGEKLTDSGCLVIGDKASLYAPGDYADDKVKVLGADKPKVEWTQSPGHFEEWTQAIKGGPEGMSNFPNYAGGLTETVLLGNLAVWAADQAGGPGKKIEWDAAKLTAKNAPEVAEIIKPVYHNGYSLDAIA